MAHLSALYLPFIAMMVSPSNLRDAESSWHRIPTICLRKDNNPHIKLNKEAFLRTPKESKNNNPHIKLNKEDFFGGFFSNE